MADELDRFRAAWGLRPVDGPFERAKEDAMEEIVQNVKLLDRRKLRRDVREILIAAGASGAIAAALGWVTEPWFRAWIVTLSVSAALIAIWRCVALLRRRSRSASESLAEFCRAELSKLETQIRLLRTLAWWYLAPILVGTNLYVVATSEAPASTMAVVFPITVLVVSAIYWLNRRSLRRELLPLRAELERCLAGLEADGGA
jgi:hypothetical protein